MRSLLSHRFARPLAVLAAVGALAANPAVQDLVVRDVVGQEGLDTSHRTRLQALGQQAMEQAPVACTAGFAAGFPCKDVDLEAVVPVAAIGAELGSDIWGWTDPETGREIAISTTYTGMTYIDVTAPATPVILGRTPLRQVRTGLFWRDVKVHADHAYLVSEESGTGLTVFDLTRLRGVAVDQGVLLPDTVVDDFSRAHNIHVNSEMATAFVVGSDQCEGGLLMFDLSDPKAPAQSGCFSEDGYVHDVECVVYAGPDTRFTGRDICFASNEDTVTIVDVTDRAAPVMLARHGYPTASYTHQGDVTPDHAWFLFGDEGDESGNVVPNTATYIVDVSDLTAPGEVQTYLHESRSIDHNLYLHDGYVWQSNYMEGLQVLDYDVATLGDGTLERVAFFDVMPGADVNDFAGAWSSYVEFPSRTVVLNSSEVGMFVLAPTFPVQEDAPAPAPEPAPEPGREPEPAPAPAEVPTTPATGGGAALAGAVALGAAARLRRR